MAVKYLRLFDPTQQFLLRNGAINTAGLLKVKLDGTDDYAPVFDEDGTRLPQPVVLDNNGRAKGLFVDASRVYWLEVDDADGYELFTIRKMVPCGGGSGSALGAQYAVQSTDGTVKVERYESDGVVYFDLSTEVTDEASVWGATFGTSNSVPGTDEWTPVPVVTEAGSSVWNDGWTVKKDCVADIAASLEMTGDSSAISTVDVMCVFSVDGTGVSTEYSQLDPTEARGRVTFEYKGELDEGQVVDCRIFVKSVEAMAPTLVAKVYFNEECDGVVGGGGAGNTYFPGEYVDISTANVISVTGVQPLSGMSAYATQSALEDCCSSVQSALSGKVDSSSYTSFTSQASSDISSISSMVSGVTGDWSSKLDASASSQFYLTSNPSGYITGVDLTPYQMTADMSAYQLSGDYAYNSSVSSKLDESAFTAYTATALTGIQQDTADISAHVSGLTGQYVEKSAISAESAQWNNVSAKLDKSASSNFYTTANESGYVDSAYVETQVSGKQDASGMTAYQVAGDYAYNSAVSAKLDASASSNFYLASNPSGFIAGVTTDSSMTGDGSVGSPLGVERVDLVFDSSMTTSVSGDSAVIGVNTSALDLSSYQHVSGMTAYQPVSGMSAYQPSGEYYSASNPSGFITGVDLSPYATTAYVDSSVSGKMDASASSSFLPASSSADLFTGVHTDSSLTGNGLSGSPLGVERVDMVFTGGIATGVSGDSALVYLDSAYMEDYAKASALSGKLDASASSSFYTVDNPSGFITGVDLSDYATTAYVDSSVSSKLDATASALFQPSGNYQPSGDYAYNSALQDYQPVSGMTAYAPSGDYADSSALGLKLDASASSSFYTTANESGFVGSAYVDSAVSGKADSSALTAYQEVTGMSAYQLSGDYAYNSALTAYQPSGDYIYASSLGILEI